MQYKISFRKVDISHDSIIVSMLKPLDIKKTKGQVGHLKISILTQSICWLIPFLFLFYQKGSQDAQATALQHVEYILPKLCDKTNCSTSVGIASRTLKIIQYNPLFGFQW